MVYEVNYSKIKQNTRENSALGQESKTEVLKVNKVLTEVGISQLMVSGNKEVMVMGTRQLTNSHAGGAIRLAHYPFKSQDVFEMQMHS